MPRIPNPSTALRGLRRGTTAVCRHDGAQGVVEFAFAGAVFLMMFMGVLDFGVSLWQYNSAASLAQDGARYAATCGSVAAAAGRSCTTADIKAYLTTRAPGLVPSKLVVGNVNANYNPTQVSSGGGGAGCTTGPLACNIAAPGDSCTSVNNLGPSNGSSTLTPGSVVCVQVSRDNILIPQVTLQATAHMYVQR
jgi:Flp pilus assembly protein TadG